MDRLTGCFVYDPSDDPVEGLVELELRVGVGDLRMLLTSRRRTGGADRGILQVPFHRLGGFAAAAGAAAGIVGVIARISMSPSVARHEALEGVERGEAPLSEVVKTLLEQSQQVLRQLVGLGQHGDAGL